MRLTQQQIDEIKELAKTHTVKEIALKTKTLYMTVYQVLVRNGIKRLSKPQASAAKPKREIVKARFSEPIPKPAKDNRSHPGTRINHLVELYERVAEEQNWLALPLRILTDWTWFVEHSQVYYSYRPMLSELVDPDFVMTTKVTEKNMVTTSRYTVIQTITHNIILANDKRLTEPDDVFRAKQNMTTKELPFTYQRVQEALS